MLISLLGPSWTPACVCLKNRNVEISNFGHVGFFVCCLFLIPAVALPLILRSHLAVVVSLGRPADMLNLRQTGHSTRGQPLWVCLKWGGAYHQFWNLKPWQWLDHHDHVGKDLSRHICDLLVKNPSVYVSKPRPGRNDGRTNMTPNRMTPQKSGSKRGKQDNDRTYIS